MEGKLNHISTSFEVDLYGNGVNDSELFELVNQFQSNFNISALKLSNIWNKHKKLSKGGLVVLSNFIFERKSISVFDLSFNNLDDQDFQVLYDRLIHLNKLYLGGNRISFSAMKILANVMYIILPSRLNE